MLPGRIPVIGNIHLLNVSLQQPGLLDGKRRSQTGHGIAYSCLIQADNVHIPFYHDDIAELFSLQQMQAIQVVALVIQERIPGVQILGLGIIQHPAPESQHLTVYALNGEDQPVSIYIVGAAFFPVQHQQPCVFQFFLAVARLHKMVLQQIPALRCISYAKAQQDLFIHPPLLRIQPSRLPQGAQQLLAEKPCGQTVGLLQAAPVCPLPLQFGIILFFRKLHMRPFRQKTHGFSVSKLLHIHNELDHRAPGVAAKAVKQLLVRRNGKRGRFLSVQGT